MNLFDEGYDNGVHMMDMMDWSIDNWIPLIISVGTILLITMALILIFIYFYLSVSVKNMSFHTNKGIHREIKSNIHTNAYEGYIPEDISFCYQCGKKIDNRSVRSCDNCGARL